MYPKGADAVVGYCVDSGQAAFEGTISKLCVLLVAGQSAFVFVCKGLAACFAKHTKARQ